MLDIATNILNLKKSHNNLTKVKEKWCVEQEEDFKEIIKMVDDLIAAAVCASNSQHSYTQLEQAKCNFISEFLEMAERYRHIDIT